MSKYFFTSESVSEGHPDKVCDLVSDTILDACLTKDPNSRVACECYATTGMLVIGGEITTSTYVDIQKLARQAIRDIGYITPELHFSADSICVMNVIDEQSKDIAQGVNKGEGTFSALGAGDQGIMFGYATDETPELMPAPIQLSHNILKLATKLRKSNQISWLRPDSKSQVTIEYENNIPKRIDAVVLSHQHDDNISIEELRSVLKEHIIIPSLASTNLLDENTKFYINSTGRFVVGGPHGDTGLTGRKIIVDTYGGMARHGGGAFSGKDATKVDRSAAYMARHIAKNIVAANLAKKVEIQLAYAIGYDQPLSVFVDTFGTGIISNEEISTLIIKNFDLSPEAIIKYLELTKPIFTQTTNYGHFGKENLPWESTHRITDLSKY
ncbi:MAG: methionine adenosyltransferase [Spirochaetota bacterium]|nr:methionine adenosyltransferase [Spirochaetota bacterium]